MKTRITLILIAVFVLLLTACVPSEPNPTANPTPDTTLVGGVSIPEKGYFSSSCDEGSAPDAVNAAYSVSLINSGFTAEAASASKSLWMNIYDIDIVVESPERGVEIFADTPSFIALAAQDLSRYSSCKVHLASDNQRGDPGYRLIDIASSQPLENVHFFQWENGITVEIDKTDLNNGTIQAYLGGEE